MSNKAKDSMVRGKKIDSIGRLDHTKGSDERAKDKRNWQTEIDDEFEAQRQEDISYLRHAMFGD